MQRRAELVRAMINKPAVMILDEPFRGLDAMTKKLMLEYYANLSQDATRTNFFVTTEVDEAIFLADRLLVMSQIPTRVRAAGSAAPATADGTSSTGSGRRGFNPTGAEELANFVDGTMNRQICRPPNSGTVTWGARQFSVSPRAAVHVPRAAPPSLEPFAAQMTGTAGGSQAICGQPTGWPHCASHRPSATSTPVASLTYVSSPHPVSGQVVGSLPATTWH